MRASSPVPAIATRQTFSPAAHRRSQPGAQAPAPGDEEQDVEDAEEGEDRLAELPGRCDVGLVAVVDADVERERRGSGAEARSDAEEASRRARRCGCARA